MSTQVLLFACSQCFSRHPFEDLSPGQQLCKECRGAYPIVKCTYCRSEFQQTTSKTTICKKCDQNVKIYGQPNACVNCNIIAAFGTTAKCQRCSILEAKYGAAVTCDQCKLRCAFDRHDNKKVDGKLLCWLCTSSYKKAVAKARQLHDEADRRMAKKKRTHGDSSTSSGNHRSQQVKENNGNNLKMASGRGNGASGGGNEPEVPEKVVRIANNMNDPNSSDHVVAMTQLKETIASLQKKLNMKDKELLEKDKLITELKARNFTAETEIRNKMKENDRLYDTKIEILNKKITNLLKEVATLTRTNKKFAGNNIAKDSGSDSPVTN